MKESSEEPTIGMFDFKNMIFYMTTQYEGGKRELYMWHDKNTDEFYCTTVYQYDDQTEIQKIKVDKSEFLEYYLYDMFESCIIDTESYLTTIDLWEYDNGVYTSGSVVITTENGNLVVKTTNQYYGEETTMTYSDINKTKITIPENVLTAEISEK